MRLTADLSAETLQARREWQDTYQGLKGKNLQPPLLYPARQSFGIEEKIKALLRHEETERIHQYQTCAEEMLKGLLEVEKKNL